MVICPPIFIISYLLQICYRSVTKASQCTDRGRYPSNEGNDCRGYIMCLIGGTTNFTQYKLTCPKGFIYSHLEQQCTNVTSYHCIPTYDCTSPGNFPNVDIKNCTSYIACVEGIDEMVTARLVQCPSNTVFNPGLETCINETEYKCNDKRVNIATVLELDNDLFEYYGNISFNSAEVQIKHTFLFCVMTILFAFQ